MKRLLLSAALLLALVAVGVVGTVIFNRESPAESTATVVKETAIPTATVAVDSTKSSPVTQPKGQYIAYSPNVIENTPGTKLLFFHATWCRQCQEIDASIKAQGIPDGVSIIKIDYDNSPALLSKYGITLQTTFVKVDDAGNTLKKFVAYREPTFDSVRRELL